MPIASNRVRKAVRFLMRLSEAFDRLCLPEEFAVDSNQDFIHRPYRSYLFPGGDTPSASYTQRLDEARPGLAFCGSRTLRDAVVGILYTDANALWKARLVGVSFRKTLTVAHQTLFLHPQELRRLRREFTSAFPNRSAPPLADYCFGAFSDRFMMEFLGVESLTVLDVSDYESAGLIHDLNEPVPPELHERFDAVIEAGSLEHIFNFPIAVGNLMRMLKVGGFMYITVPANNLCGHGFYQFSPELMFRIFSRGNGFELERVSLAEARFPGTELAPARGVYEVADPACIGRRVGLLSSRPAMLMVHARKISSADLFQPAPQQSDYIAAWARKGAGPASYPTAARRLWRMLPISVRNRLIGYRDMRACLLSNAKNYRRLL
jgi:hypothetical protein